MVLMSMERSTTALDEQRKDIRKGVLALDIERPNDTPR
jgi:hypothetical protein